MSSMSFWKKTSPGRLFFIAIFVFARPLSAAIELDELQQLDFGTVAILSNTAPSSISVSRAGIVNVEGGLLVVIGAEPGRYLVSGFPANTTVEVTAEDAVITAGGTGFPEPLSITDYDISQVRANEAGEITVQLGGILSTNGNDGSYVDAPYRGPATISFSWFEPQVGEFVSTNKEIEFLASVQTSLTLEEVQSLDFGLVFAQAANGDQASLTLAPDGSVSVNSSGAARLGSLSSPKPAVVSVSGAARQAPVQITVTSGPVFLRHTAIPDSPRFILESLETDPDGAGVTDKDGKLIVRVGGTLSTENTDANEVYPDGLYEGQYELNVTY